MKFSIITPSYQQALYVERTIQSVLNQGLSDLEYFVMDGGSQDGTLSILQQYANQLIFASEKDHGQADAVNKGLKKASGEIIGWLNSDDIYYPDTFKKVEKYFIDHPEIDVVYGDANHIDQHDNVIEKYPTEPWNVERLKKTCYLCQPAVFWRRRVLDKYGYLNDTLHFCLDYAYWLRLALSGVRFGYLNEVLAGSRLYPETKTMSSPLQAQYEGLTMLRTQLGYVPLEWLITYAVTVIKNKTRLRFPSVRFMLSVWLTASYEAVRLNGFFRGIMAFFSLPVVMVAMKI